MPPMIAVTAGDPCGIGPEVILKALSGLPVALRARLVLIGDQAVFEQAAKRLRQRVPSRVTFLDCAHRSTFHPGRSSPLAGRASLEYLHTALSLWRAKRIRALVTAPVTKWAIDRSHPGFIGQTEYLAQAMGARDVVMLFVSDRLRVALVTRHVPLARVSRAVDRTLLRTTLQRTAQAMKTHFGIRRPALALCGLNPHAGEGGLFGSEERRIAWPVLRRLRRQGLVCDGPFAADGFFAEPRTYDAVVCWYHDQGLIPFKMAARDRGCQMSLGLPIIRTSPDHGSALEIAGQGIANPGSMLYALRLAARLERTGRFSVSP